MESPVVTQPTLHTPRKADVRPQDNLGPAAQPGNFGHPTFLPAVRWKEVMAYIPEEESFEPFYDVLFRDDKDMEFAYSPIRSKRKMTSRTGHVEICNVLSRRRTEGGSEIIFELTSRVVAVKVCFQWKMDEIRMTGMTGQMEDTYKEVAVMQYLGNQLPHVSGCEEALFVEDHSNPGNNTYAMVMPYFSDGDIFDRLQQKDADGSNRISEADAKAIFRGIMLGLRGLHRNGVCHHDISIENIMLRGN